ncbi:hypothetical protein RBB50_010069 [Rhinocladiella similis]
MPLNYRKEREKAFKQLQEEIDKLYRDDDSNQFAVGFDLWAIPKAGHACRSAVVLHGLGGIGKTQLAIKYATQHKEKYTAIFWLNANNKDSLELSFRHIAQRIIED